MASTPISNDVLGEYATTSMPATWPADSIDSPQTSWGNGQGLDGEIYTPSDVESLVDLLGKIEFRADLDTGNYVRHSNLDSGAYFFDDNTVENGGNDIYSNNIGNLYSWANAQDDYRGQSITSEDGNTVIEYGENTKDTWGRRDFIRQLNNALQNEDSDSGYIFIQPRNFSASGLLNSNGDINRNIDPVQNSLENLSDTAEIVIDISSELSSELTDLVSNSKINFEQDQFQTFTSDFGDSGNISIRIADYLDDDGTIDTFELSSDLRLTLEIDNSGAEKLTSFDHAHAHINLRADEANEHGHNSHLYLYARDHDQERNNSFSDNDVTTYVESTEDDGTSFELSFENWNFRDIARNLSQDQTSLTFTTNYVSASFDTLGGHSYQSLGQDQIDQLTDSINSITIDFSGFEYGSDGEGIPDDGLLSIDPLVDVIDFSSLDSNAKLIDFDVDGIEHGGYNAEYRLINSEGVDLGQISLNGHVNVWDDYEHNDIYGHLSNDVDLNDIDSYLSRLRLDGNFQGDNYGSLNLYFQYDSTEESLKLNRIDGNGWGDDMEWGEHGTLTMPVTWPSDGEGPTVDNLPDVVPESLIFNWQKFADLEFIKFDSAILDQNADVAIKTYLSDGSDPVDDPDASISLTYNLYQQDNYLDDEADYAVSPLNQLAVLGDAVNHDSRFILDINAKSLEDDYNIESTDVTIKFDPQLFGAIQASDIKIGGALPLSNAVHIDNDAGTIRLAAASLSDLGQGTGISGDEALASIALNFDESQIQYLEKNSDGSLKISPLTFDISVNEQETIFSSDFNDGSGLLNREIVTLDQLGGSASISGQEVTLYEAQINLEQQGDGLVLGTNRIIGADASYTNLVRKGDTVTSSTEWLNVGNIQANNLTYSEIDNENAKLVLDSASFSKESVASGSFIQGKFVEDARESTTFTADIEITGEAGNVVDLSDGIVAVHAQGTSQVFSNEGKGSSNLITFQGDLNYDGRVSMKDLAYLNAGAARQQDTSTGDLINDSNQDGIIDASVANDVDADFSGKIDLADLSVLDNDWGKTLHTGDEDFQGSSDVSWDDLDSQGANTTWDNDSFKDQNAVEAEADYAGSLESPASTGVIGADGNDNSGDSDIGGTEFQDPVAV